MRSILILLACTLASAFATATWAQQGEVPRGEASPASGVDTLELRAAAPDTVVFLGRSELGQARSGSPAVTPDRSGGTETAREPGGAASRLGGPEASNSSALGALSTSIAASRFDPAPK